MWNAASKPDFQLKSGITEFAKLIVFSLVSSNCFGFFFLFAKQNFDISWKRAGMNFW